MDSAPENRHKSIALYPERWDPDIKKAERRIKLDGKSSNYKSSRFRVLSSKQVFNKGWSNMSFLDVLKKTWQRWTTLSPLHAFHIKPPAFLCLFQSSWNSWNMKHILKMVFFSPIGVSVCELQLTHKSAVMWVCGCSRPTVITDADEWMLMEWREGEGIFLPAFTTSLPIVHLILCGWYWE